MVLKGPFSKGKASWGLFPGLPTHQRCNPSRSSTRRVFARFTDVPEVICLALVREADEIGLAGDWSTSLGGRLSY